VAEKAEAPDELSHVPTHAADRDSEGLDREVVLETSREQTLEAIDRALNWNLAEPARVWRAARTIWVCVRH
jgi:hypothetical protein